MFIKELGLYMDFLQERIKEAKYDMTVKQKKYLTKFVNNLQQGIQYYQGLFSSTASGFNPQKALTDEFTKWQKKLNELASEVV